MEEENKIDPQHSPVRKFLRIAGPLTALTGLILTITGCAGLFSSLDDLSFSRFKYAWCPFVGMPLIFAGSVMTMFGFVGRVARYQAGEIAPVVKDTVNYMADGTKDGIRTIASSIGAGIAEGMAGRPGSEPAAVILCHKCNARNEINSKFCDQCGAALVKSLRCPGCGEMNDGDAKFCDNCGRTLG
jgi:hypothetical protein